MGLSKVNTIAQWSPGGSSASISASGNRTSDTFSFSGSVFQATIQLQASNTGTPAAGHTFDFWMQGTNLDNYATGEQGAHLYTLDTNDNNPAFGTPVSFPIPAEGGRVYVVSNGGAASIGASIMEQRLV
jgi:hypothetical protein